MAGIFFKKFLQNGKKAFFCGSYIMLLFMICPFLVFPVDALGGVFSLRKIRSVEGELNISEVFLQNCKKAVFLGIYKISNDIKEELS